MKHYCSIDVGLQGGICCEYGNKFSLLKMPTIKGKEINYKELYGILAYFKGKDVIVGFEKLQGIYGTSKKTAWSMAEQVGHIKAFCLALKLPYIEIPPKQWQSEMFQGVKIIKKPGRDGKMVNDTKAMAAISFQKLLPKYQLPTGPRGKHLDGIVDAALIGLYLKRRNK